MPAVLKVAVVFGEPVAPNANEGEALVVGLAPTAGEAVKAPPKRGLPLGESVPPVLLLPFHPPGVKLAPPVALMEGENAVVREGTKGEGEEEPVLAPAEGVKKSWEDGVRAPLGDAKDAEDWGVEEAVGASGDGDGDGEVVVVKLPWAGEREGEAGEEEVKSELPLGALGEDEGARGVALMLLVAQIEAELAAGVGVGVPDTPGVSVGKGAEGEGVPLPPLGVLVTRATVGVAEKEGELGVPVALPVPP